MKHVILLLTSLLLTVCSRRPGTDGEYGEFGNFSITKTSSSESFGDHFTDRAFLESFASWFTLNKNTYITLLHNFCHLFETFQFVTFLNSCSISLLWWSDEWICIRPWTHFDLYLQGTIQPKNVTDSFHLNESVVWGCFYVFFFALEQGGRRQYLITFF